MTDSIELAEHLRPSVDEDHEISRPAQASLRHRARQRVAERVGPALWTLLGLVPVVVILALAGRSAYPSFDGSMNLEVSINLAESGNYARTYDGLELFPSEIQTNSVPILLAAIGVAVVGVRTWVINAPNVLALVGLAATLSYLAGPSRTGRLLAPSLVLALPAVWSLGLGGYGETWIGMLLLAGMAALHRWTVTSRAAYWIAGWCLLGTALTVKTIAIAVLPVIVVSVVAARLLGVRASRSQAVVGVAAFAFPIVAFETFRMVHLGSVARWIDYWREQVRGVRYQSGADDRLPQLGLGDGLHRRLTTVSQALDLSLPVTAAIIVGPVIVAGITVLSVVRRRGTADLADGDRGDLLLLTAVTTMVAEFSIWWFFITPDEKAWLRRYFIGLIFVIALLVLAARLAFAGIDSARARWGRTTCVVLLCLLVGTTGFQNLRTIPGDRTFEQQTRAAAEYLDALPASSRVFGLDWWSAPQLGLVLDRQIDDLWNDDVCSIDGIDAYVVWDRIARGIVGELPPDRSGAFRYSEPLTFGDAVTVYRVTPAEGRC